MNPHSSTNNFVKASKPYVESVNTMFDSKGMVTEMRIVGPFNPDYITSALFLTHKKDPEDELPVASKYIFNGPATVTFWRDGSKTVSKAREGDEYDPVFGILANAVRKLTRNRGHAVNDTEDALREIAANINSVDDLEDILEFGALLVDALSVAYESRNLWLNDLGDEPEPEEQVTDSSDELHEKIVEAVKDVERTQDEIRQMVRNLTLDGELLW